jgi:hypothetical protein
MHINSRVWFISSSQLVLCVVIVELMYKGRQSFQLFQTSSSVELSGSISTVVAVGEA